MILVMSGPGRMMYLCLEPKPEVTIFFKRSRPQETVSSPHDAGTSMAYWLETNIQGDGFVRFRWGETKGTRRCWWRSPDDRNWRLISGSSALLMKATVFRAGWARIGATLGPLGKMGTSRSSKVRENLISRSVPAARNGRGHLPLFLV